LSGEAKRLRKPGRRAEILEAATRAVVERGIDALTFRELADALGFSTYTLSYHFGSKDGLLAAIVERVEERLREEFEGFRTDNPQATPGELVLAYWEADHPGARSYARLWLEMVVRASRHPERFPRFVERVSEGWFGTIRDSLGDRPGSEGLAALALAALEGLEVDFMLHGDTRRNRDAVEALARILDAHQHSP